METRGRQEWPVEFPRRMQGRLLELLEEEPVVLLVGPRAAGKSFTSERVIRSLGGTVLSLDDPAERAAAAADPGAYIRGRAHPILIDEYQHVPELLGAIKADLGRRGARPGSYLLTGSVRADLLRTEERLTGRIHRARLHPLSEGEFLRQSPERFLAGTIQEPSVLEGWRDHRVVTSLEYLESICRGGFPLAATRNPAARRRWFHDYVTDTVLRDALDHANIRKPDEMLKLLRLLAARSARVVKHGALEKDLRLDRHTTAAYRQVLEALFLIEELPAWKTNRSQRVIKAPKVHLTDTGLATALLRLDIEALRSDLPLAGLLLESMVVGELRKQAAWLEGPPSFFHFTESERSEVDLVLERWDGRVVGIEVKLAARVGSEDLKGLRRLRTLAGGRWLGGILLAAVPNAYTTADRVIVAPISAVWNYGAQADGDRLQ